jgi:hypothetical protein
MQSLCKTHNRWKSCNCALPKPGHIIGQSSWGWDEYTGLPGMGMISVGQRLLPVPMADRGKWVHYWEALLVGRWDEYRVLDRKMELNNIGWYQIKKWYQWLHSTYMRDPLSVWRTGGRQALWVPRLGKWCAVMQCLWRIQRAVRAFLARRRRRALKACAEGVRWRHRWCLLWAW